MSQSDGCSKPQSSLPWCRVVGVYVASVCSAGMLPVWTVLQPSLEAAGLFADTCKGENSIRHNLTGQARHLATRVSASSLGVEPGRNLVTKETNSSNPGNTTTSHSRSVDDTADGAASSTDHDAADGAGSASCQAQDMALSEIYLVGSNILLVALWPVGIVYDAIGPKSTTVIGALMCCVGGACIALAAQHANSDAWLMFPGVILSDVGSSMNSFGLFGFMWHFSERQGLLIGLANSTYSVSCMLPLLLLKFLAFEHALWTSVIMSGCSVFLCLLLVPSSDEYLGKAEEVLGCKYETPCFSVTSVVRSSYRVFVANFADNLFFSISLVFLMCSYQYYTAVMYPFLKLLLQSKSAAQKVAFAGSTVYGVLGFILSPLIGRFVDKVGMKLLIYTVTALIVAMAPMIFIPNIPVQMAGNVTGTVLSLLQTTYYSRWFALYSPPDLFGSFQGAVCTMCAIASFVLQTVSQSLSESLLSGLAAFFVPLASLNALNVICSSIFCWHIARSDMPEAPPILKDAYESVPPDDTVKRSPEDAADIEFAKLSFRSWEERSARSASRMLAPL